MMISYPDDKLKIIEVYCGELCKTDECSSSELNLINKQIGDLEPNIVIDFDKFVRNPENLPPRIVDLLYIAACVYCADRMMHRGERESLSNNAWARSFNFHIAVSDFDFWIDSKVQKALNDALTFMTGDRFFRFDFVKAESELIDATNRQLSMFGKEYLSLTEANNTDIMLFSGGLDSLAGAIQRLNENPDRELCLVSHKANNVSIHTQTTVAKHLKEKYQRTVCYGFECHNKKVAPAKEETQRSRMFLFSSIAFALCSCYAKKEFFVYENGVTSINLPKQGDAVNARTSRTTHPKTIGFLARFYRLFDSDFEIRTPYYNLTKCDIVQKFKQFGETAIISSSVSCSATRSKPKNAFTHCGCCSQCIDRMFAMYAAGLDEYDVEYADNVVMNIPDDQTTQRLYNTLRLACAEHGKSKDLFLENFPDEISDVMNYWPGNNPDDQLTEIYGLYGNFGDSIMIAIKAIQQKHDNLRLPVNKKSLLGIIANRDYLSTPIEIRVNEIVNALTRSIPLLFQNEKPKNEADFNDKVQAILCRKEAFTREYPSLQFGETVYKADHAKDGLIIESKYLRGKTSKSAISEGIAADITKISTDVAGILFVVYDPERKVTDDEAFVAAFENRRNNCFVRVFR